MFEPFFDLFHPLLYGLEVHLFDVLQALCPVFAGEVLVEVLEDVFYAV